MPINYITLKQFAYASNNLQNKIHISEIQKCTFRNLFDGQKYQE